MPEGLRKIECSKNYYTDTEGRVYALREIQPYVRGSKKYYKLIAEDGSKFYYTIDVVKRTTPENVVKTTTEKSSSSKRAMTKEEVDALIF